MHSLMFHFFQAGDVKIKDLSMPELVGIIDDTIACMVRLFERKDYFPKIFGIQTNLQVTYFEICSV